MKQAGWALQQPEPSQKHTHPGPRPERLLADHLIGNARTVEGLDQRSGLGAQAIQHRKVTKTERSSPPICTPRIQRKIAGSPNPLLDLVDDRFRFSFVGRGRMDFKLDRAGQLCLQRQTAGVRVVTDHLHGGVQNPLERTVVLGQTDTASRRVLLQKFQKKPPVRSPKAVDRLVRIPDRTHIGPPCRQAAQQRYLGQVDILVFVYRDKPVASMQSSCDSRGPCKQLRSQADQVVEVDSIGLAQSSVVGVEEGHLLPCWLAPLLFGRSDRAQRFFDGRRLCLWQKPRKQLALGLLVDNHKISAKPHFGGRLAQQAGTKGMKGADSHPDRPQQPVKPLDHLLSRFVGEGDRQNLLGRDPERTHQVGDAQGQRARLAGARPSNDQQRQIGAQNSGLLLCVELGEQAGLPAERGWPQEERRGIRLLHQQGIRLLCRRRGRLLCRRGGKELLLGVVCPQGCAAEDAHDPVFAVVAGLGVDLAAAHAVDSLGQPGAADGCEGVEGQLAQDRQFGAQGSQQMVVLPLNPPTRASALEELAEQFGQRDQPGKWVRTRGRGAVAAVGQTLDTVQNTDGHLFATDRAAPGMGPGDRWLPADPAAAMAVDVVFAFFGEEFHRALKGRRVAAVQRRKQCVVAQRTGQQRRLTAEFLGRMRVRAGDQRVAVEAGDAPVHRRVRGEPGLKGKDVRCQIAETGFDRVKPRHRAKQRKPRCPDMRRDQVAAFVDFQGGLKQVARVEPQDRAAIRADIADAFEAGLQTPHRIEVRGKQQVVDLAGLAMSFVDVADLTAEQKAHLPPTGWRHLVGDRSGKLGAQTKKTRFGRDQLLLDLRQPAWVGDVTGGNHPDPLELRPFPKLLQRQIFAGRSRMVGVNVQVSDQGHGRSGRFPGPRWAPHDSRTISSP